MAKLSRKERERLMHKKDILRAAERCFADKGFQSATMAEIAEAAEYSVGALYQYFSSKEDLFISIVVDKMKEMTKRLTAILKERKGAIEKVNAFMQVFRTLLEENEQFTRILVHETDMTRFAPGTSPIQVVRDLHEQQGVIIEKIFAEGVKKKVFRGLPPKLMAAAFKGVIGQSIAEWLFGDHDTSLENHMNVCVDIFLNGVTKRVVED